MKLDQHTKSYHTILYFLLFLIVVLTFFVLRRESTTAHAHYEAVNQVLANSAHTEVAFPGTENSLYITDWHIFTDDGIWTYAGPGTAYDENYSPADLEKVQVEHSKDEEMLIQPVVQTPLTALFEAAETSGLRLIVASAYRSIEDQKELHDDFVISRGAEAAAQFVATPGESEHHTGLAVDIDTYTPACEMDSYTCTLEPAASEWLRQNAWQHGFILRYPEGRNQVTGISGESWHYRYVGLALAKLLHETDLTFDEFILTAAPGRINRELPTI